MVGDVGLAKFGDLYKLAYIQRLRPQRLQDGQTGRFRKPAEELGFQFEFKVFSDEQHLLTPFHHHITT
jgi:hypothetical protein